MLPIATDASFPLLTSPQATAYPLYIDGQGMRLQGKRWQRYCWKCRDYWDLHSRSTTHASLLINSPVPNAAVPSEHVPVPPSDGMDHPYHNPFSLSSSQQQSWSFDGVADRLQTTVGSMPPVRAVPPYDPGGTGHPRDPRTAAGSYVNAPVHRVDPTRQARHARLAHDIQLGERHLYPRSQRTAAHPSNPTGDSGSSTARRGQRTVTNPFATQEEIQYENYQTPRRQRTITNPFGTQEEIQSENYQSPISTMFGRAWNRYRQAEEQRSALATESVDVQETRREVAVSVLGTGPPQNGDTERQFETMMNRMRLQEDQQSFTNPRLNLRRSSQGQAARLEQDNPHTHPQINPIDSQPNRPRPLEPREMTVNIACRICCEQKVDTLLEPCMHVAICRWCSDLIQEHVRRYRAVHGPYGEESKWKCPMCRRHVTHAKRVYLT
ncbi:uncharacterized protein Z520_07550 [Fonsecaea multimorphosa CBS 102226]|uniref:RING-type domain-containing protein n=1 Tax=Fonsecaea multimorphosa CBS 102226 TaxID=1442371 RepID=A0A0D2H4S6_9EURO|nr:uncharacterized protein Z520_07550 [Fonsecaea multimorphosa CBS 102226]KIX96830.1 hypothetical protein Z520_07550 [Fonsecaea multimorphosa CBS 102226]